MSETDERDETKPAGGEVTRLLQEWGGGDRRALDRLLPFVLRELHQLARRQFRQERRANHTLQTTALVHEAYLRLVDQKRVQWKSRAHFFGVAAQVMRRLLVDHARRHRADKRGADAEHVPIDELQIATAGAPVGVVDLDRALASLAECDERLARLVELRFFVGLSLDETARVLQTSPATVSRDWRIARLWLRDRLDTSRRA